MSRHCKLRSTMISKIPFRIISFATYCLLLNILFSSRASAEGVVSATRAAVQSPIGGGVKLRVIHVYADSSPYRPPNRTWQSLIWPTFSTDATSDVPVAAGRSTIGTGNYIVKIDFGTPGKSFYTVIDTGSDVTWIPCKPCRSCDLRSNSPFGPSASSSYRSLGCNSALCKQLDRSFCRKKKQKSNIPCVFKQRYGDESGFRATLSADTLSMGPDSIPGFAFGCAHKEIKKSVAGPGLIGLGRGALSLVSQTRGLYDNIFSYCLPSLRSSKFSGSLTLGKGALGGSSGSLSFTPLLRNPRIPSLYYVGLKGISVGGELLSSIPPETFELKASDGRGGTIIDSGNEFTRLAAPAYNALREAFRRRISLIPHHTGTESIFDLCYNVSSSGIDAIDAPPIVLHFEGGVGLKLTRGNILIHNGDSVVCLAFISTPPEDSESLSSIGNYQQQNVRVVYDLPNSRLGFGPEICSG